MSKKKMYFIAEAADKDEAVSEVDKVLETEVELCDSYSTLYDEVRPIDEPTHAFLLELEKANNPDEMADDYFKRGLFLKEDGNISDAGFMFWQAGGIWMGKATLDIPFYNVIYFTFEIPDANSGWFVVPAMVHY
jgi:hypothetical protein